MDFYLWRFSPETHDVWLSIAWSSIIGLGLMFLTSETVFAFVHIENHIVLGLLGRLRTYLLAWGVVNFWRAVWYIWDESTGTSTWSCWVCHIVPVVVLAAMGCMCCLLAPASTLGVDVVPNPDCADEPLFSNLPVPADDLFFLAIGRQPQMLDEATLPKKALESQKQHARMSVLGNSAELFDVDELEKSSEMTEVKDDELTAEEVAEMEKIEHVWASAGTGRRASYSSARTSAKASQRRLSYFELQRPDLDRRVSRTGSITSQQSGGAVRRHSDLFRSR